MVTIRENRIVGPMVYTGPYASFGDDWALQNTELENSIIMKGCRIESGKRIVDSLIESYSTILNSDEVLPKGHKLIVGERSVLQI